MGNFFQVPVNYLAVVVCAVIQMVLGFVWYGPLFGKPWMHFIGLTRNKIEAQKKDMGLTYVITFIASLMTAYALFHFIWYAAPGNYTLFIALKTAVWGWVGFVVPVSLSKHLFDPDRKNITLLYIETGYYLVSLMFMATVFVFMR